MATSDHRGMYGGQVWPAVQGYDLVASVYDDWHWKSFWHRNERPIVEALLETSLAPKLSLDVGCGTGDYCTVLANLCDVVGLDPSFRMLEEARKRTQTSLVCARASALPVRDSIFDIVVAARSLSHELYLSRALDEFARALRPNGLCIVSDVHAEHAYERTRIPLGNQDVYLETIKRASTEILDAAMATGQWACEYQREFRWADLRWAPVDERFCRIDRSGQRAIFFVLALRHL
jgi:SAM-dependent methyltransferase